MSDANKEEGRSLNPPYVGWGEFKKALESVKGRNPTKLSTVQLIELGISPSNAAKVVPALKFLGILKADGTSNDSVWRTLHAEGEGFPKALATLVRTSYSGVFDDLLDVGKATRGQTNSSFGTQWGKLSPNSRRMAVNFFAAICEEAGITLGFEARRHGRIKAKRTGAKAGEGDRGREQRIAQRKSNQSAGVAAPMFSVVIQVSGDEEEADLEEAFRKVRRAWETAFGGE